MTLLLMSPALPVARAALAPCTDIVPGKLPVAWTNGRRMDVNIGPGLSNDVVLGIKAAFDNWAAASGERLGTNITVNYLPAGTPIVNDVRLAPAGRIDIMPEVPPNGEQGGTAPNVVNGSVANAFMAIHPGVTDMTAAAHLISHEIGHLAGLADCEACADGKSTMTLTKGLNNTTRGAAGPTPCDEEGVRNAHNDPGPSSGDYPDSIPDTCHLCFIQLASGVRIQGACCRDGGYDDEIIIWDPEGFTRSLNFYNTVGYICEIDPPWVTLPCAADLCCVLPSRLPPNNPVDSLVPGSTCAQMGWYLSNQDAQCALAAGAPCVRKRMCGTGFCAEWPHYCWAPPPTPTPPPPPPPGSTCAEMGWYAADRLDECIANSSGSCEKKQICGVGLCQPWPNYCWMGTPLPRPTPTPAPTPAPTPVPGKTCAEMGWYAADQQSACVTASGGQACIKKQICGTGPCQPWPNYCWMGVPIPTAPPPPPPTAPPPPPPSFNTCGSQGFYGGGDYDACVRACGSCTRKQDCGGLPCEGGYCWRCG